MQGDGQHNETGTKTSNCTASFAWPNGAGSAQPLSACIMIQRRLTFAYARSSCQSAAARSCSMVRASRSPVSASLACRPPPRCLELPVYDVDPCWFKFLNN